MHLHLIDIGSAATEAEWSERLTSDHLVCLLAVATRVQTPFGLHVRNPCWLGPHEWINLEGP